MIYLGSHECELQVSQLVGLLDEDAHFTIFWIQDIEYRDCSGEAYGRCALGIYNAKMMTVTSIHHGHQVHQPRPESPCSRLTGTG